MHHLIAFSLLLAPSFAQSANFQHETAALAVPVYSGDVSRPYRVVGEIKDNLRKHFTFSKNLNEEDIYREIWERGKKMGADAVINARYEKTRVTMFNLGKTPISGTAIKFIDELPVTENP